MRRIIEDVPMKSMEVCSPLIESSDFDEAEYMKDDSSFIEGCPIDFDVDDSRVLVESPLLEICSSDFDEAEYI